MGIFSDRCGMHQDGKITGVCTGQLKRTKMKRAVDPHPEGDRAVLVQRTMCKHFSYGTNTTELQQHCRDAGVAGVKPMLDTCATRLESMHRMLYTNIRVWKGISSYFTALENATLNKTAKAILWRATKKQATGAEWQEAAEIEGTTSIVQCHSKRTQLRNGFTGAFAVYNNRRLLRDLHQSSPLMVICLDAVTQATELPRVAMAHETLTVAGRRTKELAFKEASSLYAQNLDARQLVMPYFDHRLLVSLKSYLLQAEQTAAKLALEAAYMKFRETQKRFNKAKFSRAIAVKVGVVSMEPATAAATATATAAPALYCAATQQDADSDDELEEVDEKQQEILNFRKHLKAWRKRTASINWAAMYPELEGKGQIDADGKTAYDPGKDLMGLDLGIWLKRLNEENSNGQYGPFPQMAQCYLGAQNAAAYVESLNSVLGLVMGDGRTHLEGEELEQVGVLRMNKEWIKRMKIKYKAELQKWLAVRDSSDPGSSGTSTPTKLATAATDLTTPAPLEPSPSSSSGSGAGL
jgi:hypothetical protein